MIQKHFAKSLMTLDQTLLLHKSVEYLLKAPAGTEAEETYQAPAPPKETSPETLPAIPANLIGRVPVLDTILKQPEGIEAAVLLNILSTTQPAAKSTPIDDGKGLTLSHSCSATLKPATSCTILEFCNTNVSRMRGTQLHLRGRGIEFNLTETKP